MFKSESCETKHSKNNNNESFKETISEMDTSITLNVFYTVTDGKRDEFINAIKEENIDVLSRLEKGNLKYEYYFPVEDRNQILLIETWESNLAQKLHGESEHFKKLQLIKEKYVVDVKFEKYSFLDQL